MEVCLFVCFFSNKIIYQKHENKWIEGVDMFFLFSVYENSYRREHRILMLMSSMQLLLMIDEFYRVEHLE